MPIITLRILVHELLATHRQAAAEGRDVRAALVKEAMKEQMRDFFPRQQRVSSRVR